MSQTIDPKLLEILVCPVTRSGLRQEGDTLISEVGGLKYPIRNDIPVLLPDEAELPDDIATMDEFKKKYTDQITD